jgi:hypothetical protein
LTTSSNVLHRRSSSNDRAIRANLNNIAAYWARYAGVMSWVSFVILLPARKSAMNGETPFLLWVFWLSALVLPLLAVAFVINAIAWIGSRPTVDQIGLELPIMDQISMYG